MKLPLLPHGLRTPGTLTPPRKVVDFLPAPAPPAVPVPSSAASADARRRRIWELSSNFHCSIVGTCLTTAELRQVLVKAGLPGVQQQSDHELHGRAVLLAAQRDVGSKLLQKALDRRHRTAISQFAKARTADDLKVLWTAAVQRADIPGAYWAVLTHPQATEALVRHVFGEVHMLSHLVGAANRADIRRLRELEAENAALQEKVARQQKHLRDAIVARDATIAGLNETLGKTIAASAHLQGAGAEAPSATTAGLIVDLRRQLAAETARREKVERRVAGLAAERDAERTRRAQLETAERALRQELEAVEHVLAPQVDAREDTDSADAQQPVRLDGVTLLYVGGRANMIAQLRTMAERSGAELLHHDGGIDDRSGLLAAHVARADVVFFPVDCVSHNAVAVIKKTTRHLEKPYLALRGAGLATFMAALRTVASSTAGAGAAFGGM